MCRHSLSDLQLAAVLKVGRYARRSEGGQLKKGKFTYAKD
jgi:hypothetical protein